MSEKIRFAFFAMGIALIALANPPTITGNFSGNSLATDFSWITYIGIAMVLLSFISAGKKSLDLIVIPTGSITENEIRAKKAFAYGGKDSKYMISGWLEGKKLPASKRRTIYDILRQKGVKPKSIMISGGKDSRENLEETFKKLKKIGKLDKIKDFGISSYDLHLDRFENYFKEMQEKGEVDRGVKMHRIKTKENTEDKVYGTLAKIKDKIPGGKQLSKYVGPPIKKMIDYFLGE